MKLDEAIFIIRNFTILRQKLKLSEENTRQWCQYNLMIVIVHRTRVEHGGTQIRTTVSTNIGT